MVNYRLWTLKGGQPRPRGQRLAWDPEILRGRPRVHPVVLRAHRALWRKTQEGPHG